MEVLVYGHLTISFFFTQKFHNFVPIVLLSEKKASTAQHGYKQETINSRTSALPNTRAQDNQELDKANK